MKGRFTKTSTIAWCLTMLLFMVTSGQPALAADDNAVTLAKAEAAKTTADEEESKEEAKAKLLKPFKHLSKASATCASCHKEKTTGIYQQWGRSKHYGANVGCYECHKAEKGDPDAIRHKDFLISVIVSPRACRHAE